MNDAEIRFTGEMQRLEVRPGDRFVLTVDRPLTGEMREALQSAWASFVGGDASDLKLMILDRGVKIGVLAKTDDDGQ